MIRRLPLFSIPILVCCSVVVGVAEDVKNPDTYTYVSINDADSMDPAYAYDTASSEAQLNIYETLFAFEGSSTSKMAPIIAEKVPSRENGLLSTDGKTYRIPIRKDIRFQDGTPLTPEDVRYSIMRFILQDRDAGPSSLLLQPLLGYASTRDDKGNVKPDAFKDAAKAIQVHGNEVVLRLPVPFAPLLTIFTQWAPVVSKQWAIQNGDWDGTEATWIKFNNPKKESSPFYERANGTGPFALERWDRKTMQIVMVRNEHYWRKPARLHRVIIKGINEFATRRLMLAAGDADNIYAPQDNHAQLTNIPGVTLIEGLMDIEEDPIIFFTFKINPVANPNIGSGKLDGDGIPPDFFADRDIRKGFAYSFDYAGYIRDVYRGQGTQATGCIPKTLLGHNAAQETYTFDLAKAEEHFKKAWGGKVWEKGFTFTLTYNIGNAPREIFCQIIKRKVESLNPKFRIDVRGVEWPTFLDNYQASKYPIFALGWQADYPDPHNFAFPIMYSKGDYPLHQHYANPEADRLIEAAVREVDADRRKKLYAKLQQIEFEDVPHLVLIDAARFRAQRDWVKGYNFNPVFPDAPYGSYYYPIWKQ